MGAILVRRMRPLLALVLALPVLLLAACGGSGDDAAKRPVLLRLTGPGDGKIVRAEGVDVAGSVTPGAVVTVRGERVAVTGGAFTARVPLDAGGNVIDVMASADGMAPAMTAVRVVRQLTVRVPDLAGDSPDNAKERLAAAGLRVDVHEAGGLIDELLPVDRVVCGSEPDAGSTVDSGSTVSISVAKVC
jgi:Glucodextranase, domain B/PASTA domain